MALVRSKPLFNSSSRRTKSPETNLVPEGLVDVELTLESKRVKLTNLQKPFWPELGITKRDLLNYYASISKALLPHLVGRAMVMKRYPGGAHAKFFFQKRAPEPRPEWIDTCSIEHASASVIDFPVVRDLASLLWIVNLGCIDLNPWYARCDDVNRPDYLHFDLDPTPGAEFEQVRETALVVHQALDALKIPNLAKTTGSRGIHIYVPIVRGPLQKEVWTFAKQFAQSMERLHPKLITAEYRIAKRPDRHVLVDYNQNAWGRTLASIYSVRPKPLAPVSTPVTWEEVESEIEVEDFSLKNVPARVRELGDLWKPLLQDKGRFRLETLL
jgi:bifunctional non-homologous end joining protein LigD